MADNDPKLKRMPNGATAFIHPCSICGAEFAPFGFGVELRNSKPGKWYCKQHKEQGYAADRQTKQGRPTAGIGAGIEDAASDISEVDTSRPDREGRGETSRGLFD